MRFLIKYLFITFVVVIAASLYVLCFTQQGLVIDLRYLTPLLPGTLKIEKINGTLFSDITLQDMTYQTKEEKMTLKSLMLNWYPKKLLQGKLAIGSLVLEKPQIVLFSADASSAGFSWDDMTFLHSVTLQHLVIHQLSLQKKDLRFDLTGELNNKWNFHWKLSIPKLNTLCDQCAGSFVGSGSVAGGRFVPTIQAAIQGKNLVIAEQKMGRLKGIVQGNLTITGSEKPDIAGTIHLTQGQADINALGLRLNDIQIQANVDKSNIILLQGNFRSGKGAGHLRGNVDLNKSNFPVTLTLQGNNLTILHIPKFKVAISPDVKISFIYPALEIQGKIQITKAKIKLKNYISSVSLPDETVLVGEPQAATPSVLLAAKLHLAVDLGRNIYFNYKNFETNLGGHLIIDQTPNSPATATGEIDAIKGAYTIYGQDLVIKTGRLIYTGNVLTNPGLNIEAIRKVKNMNAGTSSVMMPTLENYAGTDTIVGIRILGTAENPNVTLFSIPAGLTQAQILSSLGGEGAALMGAISAINPNAAKVGGMTNKLTKMLGLTEVNITSVQTFNTATNQMQSTPSFVVGKQISKKLSLHYSIGIFNPISIFNIRYQFNKNWAIQSETSTIDNGADILYGFERP